MNLHGSIRSGHPLVEDGFPFQIVNQKRAVVTVELHADEAGGRSPAAVDAAHAARSGTEGEHHVVLHPDRLAQRAGQRRDLGDRSDQPMDQIDRVNAHVEHRAAAGNLRIVEPVTHRPAGVGAVVGETDPYHVRVADPSRLHRFRRGADHRIEPVAESDGEPAAGTVDRLPDLLGAGKSGRHRFFQNHVGTALQCGDGGVGVEFVGNADRHQIRFLPAEHLPVVAVFVLEMPFFPNCVERFLRDVRDGGEGALRHCRIPRDVTGAGDGSASDDSDFETHTHSPSFSSCFKNAAAEFTSATESLPASRSTVR